MMTDPPPPATLADAQALIEALRGENARLQDLVAQLQARVQALEARLGQNSTNSSRPPSADPPQAPPRSPRSPSGRRPGGQPGHPAHQRTLVPPEQVDHTHDHWPPVCQHCRAPLRPDPDHAVGEPLRYQVVEVPPLRAEVTDHLLHRQRCPHCRGETRASLPPEVPTGPFGPRLQAGTAVLSSR